ncbi:PREDICTED: xaa-Pro aminopeptidase 1 [Dufourea novaeangliae]|uniref:Xaa-Pro aminopeptidase 1 n=1 Tax=Dufourea novaeangliae TaxID=178035 RepID=A0A154PSS5_DUFNO|nr:PREDICTED: xaa-Pro aminopeptidase 1 [Dufourea novaeangliae]KZC14975.1 Xaa-Pro aminopeptidase 1 [Dufourea novaeangliae]
MARRTGAMKLAKLRELMETVPVGGIKGKGIQALIVDSVDAHQSEYLRKRDKRVQFISSFTGSFGTAIVTPNEALLWTDGRYYMQALAEFDPPEAWTLMREGLLDTPTRAAWLVSNLPPKSTVGADSNLMSYIDWAVLHASLTAAGHCLMPLDENLIDKVWGDEQPGATDNIVLPQPLKFSGSTVGDKVRICKEDMSKNKAKALVITALDEVAYILNLRGSDIPYNPVFFAYVILTLNELHLFIEKSRVNEEAQQQLTDEGVNVVYHAYNDIHVFLKEIASSCTSDEKIWISNGSSYALHTDCGETKKHVAITPISVMKAIKNDVEIEAMKAAHIRDAVALVKYFAWLEDQIKNRKEIITEVSGATRLEKFRQEQKYFKGLSFPTISSVGPHGAIIHYLPTAETDVPITDKELYLCDSGAQYQDGTTDVTRTLHFGNPTSFERECFTRVFKGQCRLSRTIFPLMIQGNYLDTLARENLWSVGLNYLHGTGHGVGSYLNVHEGPIAISWRQYPNDPGLQPGMFLSNEPGYYEDEKFGVRLENIELVVKANTPYNHKNRGFLTFETVTLVPIQTKLLDVSLLTDDEIEYLNNYHAKCLNILRPLLQGLENVNALEWLERETKPISK